MKKQVFTKKLVETTSMALLMVVLMGTLITVPYSRALQGQENTITVTQTSTTTTFTTIYTTVTTGTITSTLTSTIPSYTTQTIVSDYTRTLTERATVTSTVTRILTATLTRTTTITRTSTTTTTTRAGIPPISPAYNERELNLPEGQSFEMHVEGSGRALIVRVESTERMFLVGQLIRNRYSITVYKDGQLVTTLNQKASRIENPGDPAILELVVRPERARYRIVVTTEDIGCLIDTPLGKVCNGDRVIIKAMVGHFTSKMAETFWRDLSKAIVLWDNPGNQWVGKTVLGIVGGIDVGRSVLVNVLEVSTDAALQLISGIFKIPISDIFTMVDLILNYERRYMQEARLAADLTSIFPFVIAPCARMIPLHEACWTVSQPAWTEHYNVNNELEGIYRELSVAPYDPTPGAYNDYDYIGSILRFMRVVASRSWYALRDGDLEKAARYSLYVERIRPYAKWIIDMKAEDFAFSYQEPPFYRGAYDFTRILVISYFL